MINHCFVLYNGQYNCFSKVKYTSMFYIFHRFKYHLLFDLRTLKDEPQDRVINMIKRPVINQL